MKGRLSYEENENYLAECNCGVKVKFKAKSFDEAEQLLTGLFWEITKSDCVKLPYAKCGVCRFPSKQFICRYCGKTRPWEEKDYDAGLRLAEAESFAKFGHTEDVLPFLICKDCGRRLTDEDY